MFSFDISDELKVVLTKLAKKDPARTSIIYKKIEQIISCDKKDIDHFKNLRHDLSEYKRVRIDSFVLLFKVTKSKKHVLFDKFKHHNDVYK